MNRTFDQDVIATARATGRLVGAVSKIDSGVILGRTIFWDSGALEMCFFEAGVSLEATISFNRLGHQICPERELIVYRIDWGKYDLSKEPIGHLNIRSGSGQLVLEKKPSYRYGLVCDGRGLFDQS